MRSCHAIHIVSLTIGRFSTVKLSAIPRGDARLFIADTGRQQKIGFAKDFIGAFIASPGDGLDFRYCVVYGIGIDSSTRTVGLLAT
jgi:hypothetical protein